MKIEGDWSKGSVVIADFHASRLALRWQAAPRRFDANRWTEAAIASEVGQLMLKQSKEFTPRPSFSAGRLFVEPEPPGRDVWVGHSATSNRLLEIVYQTKTLSTVLRDQILPGVADQSTEAEQRWSIFDLTCRVPAGWTLKSQRLNAGDLTLSFGRRNEVLVVRQLAPATLALARQPLEKWLDAQQQIWKKLYRVKGPIDAALADADRPTITRSIHRRMRFFLLRWVASRRVTLAAHDKARDRVVLVDSADEELARTTLATVGKVVA